MIVLISSPRSRRRPTVVKHVLLPTLKVIYFILAFVILVYFCAQVVTLFSKKAVRRITMVRIAFKSVHLAIGFVIMVPVLLISFFPLFVELQTRLLFNEDFAQR